MVRAGVTPKDGYTHGKWVASPEEDLVRKFAQLINKDILMANIGKDTPLRLEQNTIIYITALLGMTIRDPDLLPFFEFRYFAWKGTLQLTRTKGGSERKFQANIGGGYQPGSDMNGYGAEFDSEEEEGFFNKLRNSLKGKKKEGGV